MIEAALIGIVGGFVSGVFGVGGGVVFVPALLLVLDLNPVEANATSLLAIIPTAVVGGWRQHRYGNARVRDGLALGALAAAGAVGGVALANALPAAALRVGFAILMLVTAAQLVRRAIADDKAGTPPAADVHASRPEAPVQTRDPLD